MLSKDAVSGGVVNTDRAALVAARQRKKSILEDKDKIKKLEDELNTLKGLVQKLIGESDGK